MRYDPEGKRTSLNVNTFYFIFYILPICICLQPKVFKEHNNMSKYIVCWYIVTIRMELK